VISYNISELLGYVGNSTIYLEYDKERRRKVNILEYDKERRRKVDIFGYDKERRKHTIYLDTIRNEENIQ
jgi:hypothetical protein